MKRSLPLSCLLLLALAAASARAETPSVIGRYLHYWVSPYLLLAGGNISGGGEGYRVGRADRCEIAGVQLVDFARPTAPFLDTFDDRRAEPSLYKGRFEGTSALEGVEVHPREAAARAWARMEKSLAAWEQNSPVSVALARAKLARIRWFTTPLAFDIKLDNLAEGMNFPKYYEPWQRCRDFDREYFGKWEGPVASFVRGKGVFLSHRLWARLGDRSRSGLLVHEALRSLEFDDDLPIQDKKLRDFVNAMFREDPARAAPGRLDAILLDFFPVIFSHMPSATKSLAEPLSLVCGINVKGHAPFAPGHPEAQAAYFRSVVNALPEGAPLRPSASLEAALTKLRHAGITARLLELAGEAQRPRIEKMPWYEAYTPGPREAFRFLSEELTRRIERDCPKIRYAERAYSLESPWAANELLDLQKMVSLTLLQLSERGKVEALASAPPYSPELALPSRRKDMRRELLQEHQLGSLPEVIEAVGGKARFNELDRRYDAWYWAQNDNSRHLQFLLREKLPWPATYPGPDLLEFIQKWRRR